MHPDTPCPEPLSPVEGRAGIVPRLLVRGPVTMAPFQVPPDLVAHARRMPLHGGRKTGEGPVAGKFQGRRLQDVGLGVLMQPWLFRSPRAQQMGCTVAQRCFCSNFEALEDLELSGVLLGLFPFTAQDLRDWRGRQSSNGKSLGSDSGNLSSELQDVGSLWCLFCKAGMRNHPHLRGVTVSVKSRAPSLAHIITSQPQVSGGPIMCAALPLVV